MRALVIPAAGNIEIASVEDPTPGRRDVVVQVAACVICGTDLHILQGEFATALPIVPGHEFAGEVVAVGRDVDDVRIGNKVAVDPTLYGGECRQCRLGRLNLCVRWRAIGVSDARGAAEFALAPVANCVVLPEGVRTEGAALIELLWCDEALDRMARGLGRKIQVLPGDEGKVA
jgi:threonine dehydrogenase-like Zn-dependent dehydrogenase